MSTAPVCYRVVVRSNLVVSVDPLGVAPDVDIAATPLEVSSLLARNHQSRGCLDGVYFVPDAEMARQVAALSLDFMAKLVEKSIASLNAATLHPDGWRNPLAGHGQEPASSE
ncbi:MAG: hypothetical protein KJZ80_06405 [Hyphomicrobiaceae bacterium]|nr:hypothetical protein [Hyphomicrobiaceae bacterium]